MVNAADAPVMLRHAAAPTLPTSGGGAETGYVIAAGAVARVRQVASGLVHAVLTTGTGTIYFNRLG